MGLDMYLTAKKYVSSYSWADDYESKVSNPLFEEIRKAANLKSNTAQEFTGFVIEFPLAYWRKVNAVHRWFIEIGDGIDECQDIVVNINELKELYDTCQKVLSNHSLAPELLPTQSGFFFGGIEYDDWYFKGLKDTIKQLEPIIEDNDNTLSYIYSASW